MSKILLPIIAAAALFTSCAGGDKCCKECCCKDGLEFGVQLYSVRDLIGDAEKYAANHEQILSQLAEMGYKSVEAANYSDGLFYGVTPEQFKADVEAAGLKVLSSHTNRGLSDEELASGDLTAALAWWDEAIVAHKAAGMQYIVVPWMGVPETLAQLKVQCDYLNAIGKKCVENGILFGYHNHSHEFTEVEGTTMYDYMIENTDPECVFFQMDVYWTVNGRKAPVEYFQKYPGRFKMLHIKDHYEVGQSGMVGFDAIFRNVSTAGAQDFIVEMEGTSVGDIMETCRISIDYLTK